MSGKPRFMITTWISPRKVMKEMNNLINNYNQVAPDSALGMMSPKEYLLVNQ